MMLDQSSISTKSKKTDFKKRPTAQMIALALSLSGYGMVSNRAQAIAVAPTNPSLSCDITNFVAVTDNVDNNMGCTVTSGGYLFIEQNGHLTNTVYNWLTNDNYLSVYANARLGNANLTNNGTLTNNGSLDLSSYGNTTASVINNGTFDNFGELDIYTANQGTTQFTNNGTLTNNGSFTSETYDLGDTNTITNNGSLINESNARLYNTASYNGESTLINNSTLTNNGSLVNESEFGGTSTLNNSGTLTNNGSLSNQSNLYASSALINSGTFTNNGDLYNRAHNNASSTIENQTFGTFNNNGALINDQGSINNYGTFTNGLTGSTYNPYSPTGGSLLEEPGLMINTGDVQNKGSFTNNGILFNGFGYGVGSSPYSATGYTGTFTNTSNLTNYGVLGNFTTLTNTGTINNNGMFGNLGNIFNDSGTFNNTSGVYLLAESTFNNTNGGVFRQTAGDTVVNGQITGSGVIDIQGGTLSGSGSIEGSQIIIGADAQVNPGNSPGTLLMIGDTTLSGSLNTEIVSSVSYDILDIQGELILTESTQFNFDFDSNYMATDGDAFTFINAFNFVFDGFDLNDMSHFMVTGLDAGFNWSISFFDDVVQGDYFSLLISEVNSNSPSNPTNVSAPATLGMFLLSLPMLAWLKRRSKKVVKH
ncbi:beta strand repeat-containing protein [Paraglaciecola aestuariivivens]